jgi:vancomycin permeability regulator SanA
MELGVPEEAIICDPYGLSTYESVWRSKNVYGVKSAVIVSQKYHLYRGLYICEKLGVEALGAPADLNTYGGQTLRDIREIAARFKDFFLVLLGGTPKYIGE